MFPTVIAGFPEISMASRKPSVEPGTNRLIKSVYPWLLDSWDFLNCFDKTGSTRLPSKT